MMLLWGDNGGPRTGSNDLSSRFGRDRSAIDRRARRAALDATEMRTLDIRTPVPPSPLPSPRGS